MEEPSEILREALVSLDDIHVETEFRTGGNLMRSAPKFLEGACLSAVRLAMDAPTMKQGGFAGGSCSF